MANVETDPAINPKPIISLMLGVSVGFWAKELAQYLTPSESGESDFTFSDPSDVVTLVSGLLFLLDLLCIVWWYARYIYRIQPNASFGTYFLDFVICSMFALGANSWTEPTSFLFATVLGSAGLGYRFWRLYMSPDVSLTDRRILFRAGIFLGVAFLVALAGLSILNDLWVQQLPLDDQAPPDTFWDRQLPLDGHALPGTMALIGVVLTLYLRGKIDVAVDIYSAKHAILSPTQLFWPREGLPGPDQRIRIRQQTQAGLEDFNDLFQKLSKHDRIHSRVHSATDLRIQSYVLAVPSCEKAEFAQEIKEKAFMVALSHWLDDLVDGRNDVAVCKQILDGPELSDQAGAAEALFELIYRPLVVRYTDKKFYQHLVGEVREACLFPFNQKYMLLGLNRVAYGAALFSPNIRHTDRQIILDKHNVFLKEWNVEGDHFTNEVEAILDGLVSSDAGSILLGLTTKTAQEISMSSETQELNVGLSLLFSILYAPLIYYHNIGSEVENGEMIPLQAFETDYDVWIEWLRRTRKAIDEIDSEKYENDGQRKHARAQQIEMAYRCFQPQLPPVIDEQMSPIFLGKDPI
ncbi:MAG: hypothetical protein V3T53_04260 [Phycisphaerales bacterium]